MSNAISDVFIVDDDVSVRESVEALLADEGFSTQAFNSGKSCLKEIRKTCPACVVLDVDLPGLSGLELQQILNAECPGLPIIFITAHGDIPMSVQVMKRGAVDFLTKPFRNDALSDAVRSAVESGKRSRLTEADVNALRSRYALLTPRERTVLKLIVKGMPNKNIGFELGITEPTVKAHRGKVMHKMNAESLAELVQMTIKLQVPLG